MRHILIFTVLFLLCGCDIQKEASKVKSESQLNETIETSRKRKGDSVSFVPRVHYKDTTIYTVNREGTTLRTVYDQSGNVSQVDCFASAIEEMQRTQRELTEQLVQKEKTKSEQTDNGFLYGIAAILAALALVLYVRNNKQ
jgi:hypothetical protein